MTAGTAAPAALFTLRPGGPDEAGPDVLGLWTIDRSDPTPVSFTPGAALPVADLPTWCVDLPADPTLADASLAAAEARVGSAEAVLASVPAALLDVGRRHRESPIAFGTVGVAPPSSVPEARLLTALDALWGANSAVAFGLGDTLTGVGGEAVAQFRAFLTRVSRAVLVYARVETQITGQLLARTVVGWTGDAKTIVGAGLDVAGGAQHGRVLTLAMASRAAMLRTIALAARGAVILTALLSGGGAVAAIPAAWRFIRDVLALIGTDGVGGQTEVLGGR